MKINYTMDYDALIKQKQKEINQLKQQKSKEKESFLEENNLTCDNCRYGWLDAPSGSYCYTCEKGYCKLCMGEICDEWEEETESSKYLKEYYDQELGLSVAFQCNFKKSIADASIEKVKKFCEVYFMKE